MRKKLENNDYSFEDLFSGSIFKIPDYQRYFSWGKNHYSDLWHDLQNVMGRDNGIHYMGTVVFRFQKEIETKPGQQGYNKYHIVDGQQRLASLILLTKALIREYEIYKNSNSESDYGQVRAVEDAKETFIKDTRITEGNKKTRLRLQGDDDKIFRSLLRDEKNVVSDAPSQERLKHAYNFFRDKIRIEREHSPEMFEDFIFELLEAIRGLQFMVYQTDDERQATLIFESINDRGKPLSNLEKTKGFLMHKLCISFDDEDKWRTEARVIKEKFADIYSSLQKIKDAEEVQRIDEDDIQRYHFISYMPEKEIEEYHKEFGNRRKTRKRAASEYLNVIKWWFDKLHNKNRQKCIKNIKEYIKSLERYFNSFKEMVQFNKSGIKDELKKLFVMGRIANFYPILLSFWEKYSDDVNILQDVIDLIETAAFRMYAIGNKRSNTGRGGFYELAYNFYTEEFDLSEAEKTLKEIVREYEDLDHFEDDLTNKDFFENITQRDIRYLLFFYEDKRRSTRTGISGALSLDKIVENPQGKYTIEHIWPENKDELELTEKEKDQWEQCVHNLGNLTLITRKLNGKIRSDPYSRKKEVYPKSNFLITQDIPDEYPNKWKQPQIQDRTQKIVKFAKKRWRFP